LISFDAEEVRKQATASTQRFEEGNDEFLKIYSCILCTFEDVSSSDRQLLESFTLTLFDWSRAWGFTTSTSITEFISSLSLLSHDVKF
jgi:hypothetical protein